MVQVAAQTGRGMSQQRPNRPVHPLAWWAWAACLAVSAMQTINPNPFLLLLLGAVACFVVASCRGNDPWSRSLAFFLRLGAVVIVIRVVIEIFFGERGNPGHVLFTMPHVPLPSWAAAVSIGGAVTLESHRHRRGPGAADRRDPCVLRRSQLAGQSLPSPPVPASCAL